MIQEAKAQHSVVNEEKPKSDCEQLADQGDVLGLLDYLEDDANPLALRAAMNLLSRCIRQKARTDLSALCDDAFARIIGMATLLLARTQLYITERLTTAEQLGAHAKSGLPCDLVDEGWLERAERISRFISEMATIRSRVQHVDRLNGQANGRQQYPNWVNSSSPMDADPEEARNGQGMPPNERFHCPESRIELP